MLIYEVLLNEKYVPIKEMIAKSGTVKQTIDFREVHFEKYKKI